MHSITNALLVEWFGEHTSLPEMLPGQIFPVGVPDTIKAMDQIRNSE